MYWKAIASCMIVFGTQGIGISLYCSLKNRLYHLQCQKKILCSLEEEIFYLYSPAIQIVRKLKSEAKEPYKSFFAVVLKKVSDGVLLYEAWREGVEEICQEDPGFQKTSCVIENFAKLFLNIENHEQKNEIMLLKETLDEEIDLQKEKIRKEGRLYYLLCSMAGIFFIILFL